MTIAVFLGPSLPLEKARELLDARYLPPARHGDVLRLVREGAVEAIVLIDGAEFGTGPLVWHKEILAALDRGIAVFGAAGSGAVRAAELARWGMRGFGEVYRLYSEEVLDGDDAVASPSLLQNGRWRRLAEPFVNVRATVEKARREGLLDENEEELLLASAGALFYRDRTVEAILDRAVASGAMAGERARTVEGLLRDGYVDVQARDAEALLGHLARQGLGERPEGPPSTEWKESHVFRRLVEEERQESVGSVTLRTGEIAAWGALARPEGFEAARRGLNRFLGLELARQRELRVTDDEIDLEATRFRRRKGLADEAAFRRWLGANHLDDEGYRRLMEDEATLSRLRHWLFVTERFGTPVRALLDEMRLEGTYEATAAEAARAYDRFRTLCGDLREEAADLGSREDFFAAYVEAHVLPRMDRNFLAWCEEMGIDTGRALLHALVREGLRRFCDGLGEEG